MIDKWKWPVVAKELTVACQQNMTHERRRRKTDSRAPDPQVVPSSGGLYGYWSLHRLPVFLQVWMTGGEITRASCRLLARDGDRLSVTNGFDCSRAQWICGEVHHAVERVHSCTRSANMERQLPFERSLFTGSAVSQDFRLLGETPPPPPPPTTKGSLLLLTSPLINMFTYLSGNYWNHFWV